MVNANFCSCSERLAYWYLRLNGFLLWENFIIHPDRGSNQRTDADLVGVRFLQREDIVGTKLRDDYRIIDCRSLINLVIAEVKSGRCALNGPWTRKEDENVQRLLRAVGCFRETEVSLAAESIYNNGRYQSDLVTCRLVAIGNEREDLPIPDVEQILFKDMIAFCYERLHEYRIQKASVGNWSIDGQRLLEFALADRFELFDSNVHRYFRLRS